MFFSGRHELSIDAKQRLAIPAKYRTLLKEARAGQVLYIMPGLNGAPWLWPEPTFEKIAGAVEPTLAPDPAQMDFDEVTFPDVDRLEIDAAGRIRLPAEHMADAGLGNRVLLLGMRDHLEIWDPDRWAAHRGPKSAKRAEITERVARRARGSRD